MGEIDVIGRGIRGFAFGCVVVVGAVAARPAEAGPPFVSDDPEPTDYQHYEIYLFTNGSNAADGTTGESGVDFNYGALPDLQLTAVVPMAYSLPRDA
ncbi:MAG TPA: hypothetical protein VHY80_16120, partial [Stellaceae bacterium]|nr:hypothetical protein [Stellaceae bacterium]